MKRFVSSSGGKIFTVRGDWNSVNWSIMGFESRSNLEVSVPNFESSIPSDWSEIGFKSNFALSFKKRGISDTWNPFSVVGCFTGEFALSKSVPQFNSFVGTWRDNLSIIRRETTGEDFFKVSFELSSGESSSKIPKSKGFVPWGRNQEIVILR